MYFEYYLDARVQEEVERKMEQLKVSVPPIQTPRGDDEDRKRLTMQTGWTEQPYSKKQALKMQDKVQAD